MDATMMKKQLMDAVRSLFDDGVLRAECVTCHASARRIGRGLDFECPVHGRIHWAANQVRAFPIDDVKLPWDLVDSIKKSKRP